MIQANTLRSQVTQFLKERVMDKALKTDAVSYQLENGKMEGAFSSQATFTGFMETKEGFRFDLIMVNKEELYQLDNETRTRLGSKESTNVFRYEWSERMSTGELSGLNRIASTTVANQEALAWALHQLTLNDNSLSWQETQVLYRDMTHTTGKYRPVAQDARSRLFFQDGKLQFEYVTELFEIVNIRTLERKPSQDTLPGFLFKESK